MYTATIKSKSIINGTAQVYVEFTDDVIGGTFSEIFSTSQKQPIGWIENQIKIKLYHLNNLPEVLKGIDVGKDISLSVDSDSGLVEKTEIELYQENLIKFEKFVGVVAKGLTTIEHEEFINLKKWLTDNFKPEYLGLF